jgi:aspartate racemase
MHKVAAQIEAAVSIPFLHIADPTAETIRKHEYTTIGLIGTRFTMEQDFYRGRLEAQHGLSVLTPNQAERESVHKVIYDELCHGKVLDTSRGEYRRIIDGLQARGAQAVILGCTEITLLIKPEDVSLPVFDTTRIHAEAAVSFAID